MGELLPRLSILTTTVLSSTEQGRCPLGANFNLVVGNYDWRCKIPTLCTTQKARGTIFVLFYLKQPWRFISVALSRGSPRADVIRYPAL